VAAHQFWRPSPVKINFQISNIQPPGHPARL
jgi:hypothetical protein